MVIRSGKKYNLSLFARQLSKEPINLIISLQSPSGKIKYAENTFSTSSPKWKKYTATLTANANSDSVSLVILATIERELNSDDI
jgi:alpha-L-arabinofuranosidase